MCFHNKSELELFVKLWNAENPDMPMEGIIALDSKGNYEGGMPAFVDDKTWAITSIVADLQDWHPGSQIDISHFNKAREIHGLDPVEIVDGVVRRKRTSKRVRVDGLVNFSMEDAKRVVSGYLTQIKEAVA
jgi:hypothetical protein